MTTLPSDGGNPVQGVLGRSNVPAAKAQLSSDAVRILYDTYGREVLEFLSAVLRDVNSAQDVLQTTFHRVLESGHTAAEESIKGWIFKVAMQEVQLLRRQRARQDRKLQRYAVNLDAESSEPLEQEVFRNEELIRVRQLIEKLPIDQRQVIEQRLIADKSFATIAEELEVPLGTVLSRMRLGLDKLRKWSGNV